MKINGKKYRPLKVGEIMKSTDIFVNGHEVETYSIGQPMLKMNKKFYQAYREVIPRKNV